MWFRKRNGRVENARKRRRDVGVESSRRGTLGGSVGGVVVGSFEVDVAGSEEEGEDEGEVNAPPATEIDTSRIPVVNRKSVLSFMRARGSVRFPT